ncbi:MAG TPA: recombinase RecA [Kiritimatiellia bacterium]|nr:recombinase RecA [Kiritimatiellia bacterium]HPA77976.1 recombinase RecA [Kiritimatiellia bacterium]HQQ03845.1 recombinase RecA [Kiritimatiellia bacterium]
MAARAASKEKDTDKKTPSALSAVLAQIQKEYGEGAIMRLGADEGHKQIPSISTGALTLDLALGIGGVPRGRVIEIFGPESSGKTTLVSHIIANAQKQGGLAAFIDAEHAFDPMYARKIGVNLDDLLISQPDSGEEALNIAETLVKSNSLDVVAVDSVAALAPQAELDGAMGSAHVGLQARLMSQALRKLTAAINKSRTCCIFTNQIREKIGVMFGNPETTPGGRALKFYASVRLDIRRVSVLKDTAGNVYGSHTRVKVVKNKVAPPFTQAEFDILYAEGISWTGSILDAAIQYDLIDKRGSWLAYEGQQLGQGREAAKAFLAENREMADAMVAKITEKAHSNPSIRGSMAVTGADVSE